MLVRDGDHQQCAGIHVFLRDLLHVTLGDRANQFRELFGEVGAQAENLELRHETADLALAIEPQREAADYRLLGRIQFSVRDGLLLDLAYLIQDHPDGFVGAAVFGLEDDLERAGEQPGLKETRHSVGEARFAAHRLDESRSETAAAEDVVHHLEPVKVGIRTRDASRAEYQVGLRNVAIDDLEMDTGRDGGGWRRRLRRHGALQTREFLFEFRPDLIRVNLAPCRAYRPTQPVIRSVEAANV